VYLIHVVMCVCVRNNKKKRKREELYSGGVVLKIRTLFKVWATTHTHTHTHTISPSTEI